MSDMPAIDHVGFQVGDFAGALAFYTAALKPLGWAKVMEFKEGGYQGAGLGPDGKPMFWISAGGKTAPHVHLAFAAPSRAAVDAFYEAAMKAGGKDNGAPGVRKEYHPNYYAAFVLDPEGHNVEAVIHAPEGVAAKKPAAKRAAKTAKKSAKPAKKAAKVSKKAEKAAKKAAKKEAKKAGKKKRK